jgi:hypothetical protein
MEITIKGITAGHLEIAFDLKNKGVEITVTNHKGEASKVNIPKEELKNAIKAL